MTTNIAPAALAKSRPERTVSLLVVENWRQTAHSIVSPFGDCSRTPAFPTYWLDKPSVHIIHVAGLSSPSSFTMNSAMKSAKAHALIMVLGRYRTSNSLSSIVHITSHLAASGLLIAFHSGFFVRTTMVCA